MNALNTEYPCDKYYVAQPEGGVIASDNYPFDYHDNSECRNKIYTSHLYPETKVKLCFQFFRFQAELLVTVVLTIWHWTVKYTVAVGGLLMASVYGKIRYVQVCNLH